jgi:hypothetical protein
MNGASEATLQELLLVAKAMNVNLSNFIKASGGTATNSPTGGLASAASSAASSFSVAGLAAKAIAVPFNLLGTVIGGIVGTATDLAGNFYDFSKAAMNGTASLGQLALVFKDIPLLGRLAPIIAEVFDYADKLAGFYRNMTKAGASFGGDLFAMSTAAAKSGLSLQGFSAIVSQNGEIFSTMGFDVQSGIDKFTQASGALLGPGSKFSKQLFGLGYTADEAGAGLAMVIARQGIMGTKNALTSDQLAEKTKDYLVELDGLTKLTGIQKADVEAILKKNMNDQGFQLFKGSLDKGGKAVLDSLETVSATFGPGVADAIKLGSQGIIGPTTKAGQDLNTASRGMYTEIAQLSRELVIKGYSPEEAKKIMLDKLGKASGNIVDWSNSMTDQQRAVNAEMFTNVGAPMINMGQQLRKGNITIAEAYENAKKRQDEQGAGNAAALGQANQSIQNFGNGLTAMMNKVLGPVTTQLVGYSETFMKMAEGLTKDGGPLSGMLDGLIKSFGDVTGWLGSAFKDLGNAKTSKEFFDTLSSKATEAWNNIKKTYKEFMDGPVGTAIKDFWAKDIKPAIMGFWDDIKKGMGAVFKDVLDFIVKESRNTTFGRMLFGSGSKEEQAERELKEAVAKLAENQKVLENKNSTWFERKIAENDVKAYTRQIDDIKKEGLVKDKDFNDIVKPVMPQPKASGGPINAGSYLVGEKGPELLNVGASGNVVSNDSIAALLARTGESDKAITSLMNMLNTQNKQMLSYIAEMTDYTKRNNDALKGMSGDAFA